MAKIPINRVKRTLKDLKIGEVGYVPTSALVVDWERDAYLVVSTELLVEPSDTTCLQVKRVTGAESWDVTLVWASPYYRGYATWEVSTPPPDAESIGSYREQELSA